MAVTVTLLTAGTTGVAPPSNTASISPTAGSVIFPYVVTADATAAAVATVTGLSLTFDEVTSRVFSVGGSERRITLLRAAAGGSPGSGALTIASTGASGGLGWGVLEANSDPGNNGADGIIQFVSNDNGTGASPSILTITLAALANAANATVGVFGSDINNTWTCGETEIAGSDVGTNGGLGKSLVASWAQPGVLAMDATHATAFSDLGGIAFELQEATAGGAITGTVALTITPTGALTGSGALAGTVALSVTPVGALTGSGALAGSVAMVLTPVGALTGNGALTGSAAITLAVAGDLTAADSGAITGQVDTTITVVGALTGTGNMAGDIAMSIATVGSLVDSTPVVADDQPSGGFYFGYDRHRYEREQERKERQEREQATQQIQDDTDRQIAELLRVQEAKDAERKDLGRIQDLADKYAKANLNLPTRVRAAVYNATEQRTTSALLQMQREVERMLEEEEMAIVMLMFLED